MYTKIVLKHWLFGFLLLAILQNVNAQEKKDSILLRDGGPTYSVGLIANGLKNPGLNLRYEYPLLLQHQEAPKRKIREINLNGNLGFYWDPYTHVATYATAGILYRRTTKRNRQRMIAINPVGFMRNFLHEVYEVEEDLTVVRKRFSGISYYAPEIIVGIGKLKKNKARFFNFHLMLLSKYNLGVSPLFHFEYGFRF